MPYENCDEDLGLEMKLMKACWFLAQTFLVLLQRGY